MNTQKVSRVIERKFMSWVESIEDIELQHKVRENTLITGGCIVSLLLNEQVNDYDVYFKDKHTALAVARYYVQKFNDAPENKFAPGKMAMPEIILTKAVEPSAEKPNHIYDIADENTFDRIRIKVKSAGVVSEGTDTSKYDFFETVRDSSPVESFSEEVTKGFIQPITEADNINYQEHKDEKPYRPVFISDNAISLSGNIQLIIRFYGNIKEIHTNFDYKHCLNFWDSKSRKLILTKDALESIVTRELKYVGSKYPIASAIRMRKFLKRGWWINAGQILKMCLQLSELDLTNINVLDEQLTGVDTAYFYEMLQILRNAQEGEDKKQIDTAYVVTLIDKLF